MRLLTGDQPDVEHVVERAGQQPAAAAPLDVGQRLAVRLLARHVVALVEDARLAQEVVRAVRQAPDAHGAVLPAATNTRQPPIGQAPDAHGAVLPAATNTRQHR